MKCPREDCNGELIHFPEEDYYSLLGEGTWRFHCCDECGAELRFKEPSEEGPMNKTETRRNTNI
jgi:hypothetical protein